VRLRRFPFAIMSVVIATFALARPGAMTAARAQMFGGHHERRSAVTSIDVLAKPTSLKPGGHGILIVTVHLAAGFHINAAQTDDPQWIPTALSIAAAPGIAFHAPVYPVPAHVKEAYYNKPLVVYTGTPVIRVPFLVKAVAGKGPRTLTASLSYQGCNDTICLPPGTKSASAIVTVQ